MEGFLANHRAVDQMRDRKRHKLIIITPSGEEITVGFMSPSRNGLVLGMSEDNSHLTIITKKGEISAHITPQEHPEDRRYFPPMTIERLVKSVKSAIEEGLFFKLSASQLSKEVFYVSQRFLDWYNSVMKALVRKETSEREIVYIFDVKGFIEKIPKFVEELRESPFSIFGSCKAGEILEDNSKALGMIVENNSKRFLYPLENELYAIDFQLVAGFNLQPEPEQDISNPIAELARSLGISQYIEDIKRKLSNKLAS